MLKLAHARNQLAPIIQRDKTISLSLWAAIVGSIAAVGIGARYMPTAAKYGFLVIGGSASLAGMAYERNESTKLVRRQDRVLRRQMVQGLAIRSQDAGEVEALRQQIQVESETLAVVNSAPAEVQAVLGVPQMTLGQTMDANPATATVDVAPKLPTVNSPKDIARHSKASTGLQEYVDFLDKAIVSKMGRERMSMVIVGASRDGKSTMAQAIIYAIALKAICKNNRVIVMVLTRHGIDREAVKSDPYHPTWNGLPELQHVPEALESCIVKSTKVDDFVRYVQRLKEILDQRMVDDDYSWKDPASKTPQIILCIDEAINYFRAMDDAVRANVAVMLSSIAHEGSKYGVGVQLYLHDITKERTGVDPDTFASMQRLWGYNALKRASNVDGRSEALAEMKLSLDKAGTAGFYSEELGYFAPAPIKHCKELHINWQPPRVDEFDMQVSLVNVIRARVKNAKTLEDDTLVSLAREFSTFTTDELTAMLPSLRALLSLPKAEYEGRVALLREKILEDTI